MKHLMTWMKCSCSNYLIALGFDTQYCKRCGDELFSTTGETWEWSIDEFDSTAFNEMHWLADEIY